ncbi:hypothetical protein HMPREF1317_0548 [Schaalia georgiae F0490]|uniref:Uncharacterized protein n=1 Tax=Schaalia georgiae F0490 TaxID=1125717 RepID=J0NHS8_9ACTO|nr:hypothetical protein HMPREF1317_0548 [Schaalia georgiae F0490]
MLPEQFTGLVLVEVHRAIPPSNECGRGRNATILARPQFPECAPALPGPLFHGRRSFPDPLFHGRRTQRREQPGPAPPRGSAPRPGLAR